MDMLLHTINQAALVKSTDNSGNSCNMRASHPAHFTACPRNTTRKPRR